MKLRSIEAEWQRTKYSKEADTIGERVFSLLEKISSQYYFILGQRAYMEDKFSSHPFQNNYR